jgi:hypothetical protein
VADQPVVRVDARRGRRVPESGGRLSVHAHFYQPDRRDPFSGVVPPDPSAAPAHNWTERVAAECYGPNAERGNLRRIGWDIGPALATWLRRERPATYTAVVDQAAGPGTMAMAYHHSILPLASIRDRRTEIRWGLRDFELRFGRRATGLWLPETAVDLPTLRICAEEGIRYTILAPWQTASRTVDPRRLQAVEIAPGKRIVVAVYDGELSGAVSFVPAATVDADRFAYERVAPRLAKRGPRAPAPLALIATDGELYGHHQPFRDLFLARLTGWRYPWFSVTTLGAELESADERRLPVAPILESTSWSCHHGLARWSAECPDATDGRWKQPLRAALDRLAAAIDLVSERELAALGLDLWSARDDWVDVASEFTGAERLVEKLLASAVDGAPARAARMARDERAPELVERILRAQTSRLAMFGSDAWFWEDPTRSETGQALRFAGHAVRLVDEIAGTALEDRLIEDLAALRWPATLTDGAGLYVRALEAVGQSPSGAGGKHT